MAGCHDYGACHSHHGQVDRDSPFRRILWIALAANAAMAVAETVASQIGRSVSLQADAIDFFGDAASYAITLLVLGGSALALRRAALAKAAMMTGFGLWVLGTAVARAVSGVVPDAIVMGPMAVAALAVNLGVAAMLFRHRAGDSNRESLWLCSRNDALGNVAVMLAAAGVWGSGTGWPDIAVATVIAGLALSAALRVIMTVRAEQRALPAPGHAD